MQRNANGVRGVVRVKENSYKTVDVNGVHLKLAFG
jgi:hypothetical protein